VDGYIAVTQPINQENNSYMSFKSEGKTKYKPVIGKAKDLV